MPLPSASRGSCQSCYWLAILLAGTLLVVPVHATFEVPGNPPEEDLVLQGGWVHPVSGPTIEDGCLVVREGRIAAVGRRSEVEYPEGAIVVDTSGQHIYPGLIDADSAIGLVEIAAVRATVDDSEVGMLNANTHALTAFNPDSELIPVARSDGILLALSVPRGPFVTGLSALMQLDGWQGDQMALRPVVGLHVSWPAAVTGGPDTDPQARSQFRRRQTRLAELADALDDARIPSPSPAGERSPSNLRLEALQRVVHREIPLMVHTNGESEIQEAVAFAIRQKIRLVIVGGYDAPRCADLLCAHNVPVIVTGTYRLPARRHSPVHEPFTVPARLQSAGVTYCLAGYDRFSASAIRNLPQHAGTAAAFGLTRREAVRAITLSAAEILGVADRVGSLEPGKDATLIVTSGPVLEIDSQVRLAYIQGRPVDLDNRHKRLWRKYQVKYRRLVEHTDRGPQESSSEATAAARVPGGASGDVGSTPAD